MHGRAQSLRAPTVDRSTLQVDVTPAQSDELACAQPMSVCEQDHRVVARAVAGFLGGAHELRDFAAGEIGAKALCGSHERPSYRRSLCLQGRTFGGGESGCCRGLRKYSPGAPPALRIRLFWGEWTRN